MKGLNFINVAPLILFLAVSLVSEVQSLGCWSCWSNVTAECATGPINRVDEVDCSDTDSCLTAIVDGNTFRGCASSLSQSYPLKESCSVEFCNSRIYPTNRLICYKCQGNQCTQPAGNSRPCVNYSPDDQCYTQVISDANTIRGCMSDGNVTATEYTESCTSNLCNNQRSFETLECLTCASNVTLDCVRPTDSGETCSISVDTTCSMNVLLGRQEYCYTYQSGDYIERGCSLNSAYINKKPMSSIENETKCYAAKCNSECIPQGVCYVCDSTTDPNCGTNLTELTPETCSSQGISSCYTCLGEDNTIYRGCGTGSNLNSTQECVICTSSTGCNDYIFDLTPTTPLPDAFQCYQCNGTADCLLLNDNNQYLLPCDGANDTCVQIMASSKMYRGCRSGPIGEICHQERELCYECDTPGCNNRPLVMPTNLTCMQCFSLECEWGMEPSASSPCSKVYYFQNDSCYTYQAPNRLVERGCAADLRCISNGWDCDYCSTDDCNNENLVWQYCLQCTSKNDNDDCSIGNKLTPTRCPGDIITYQQRGCFVRRRDDHIERGCISALNLTELTSCVADTNGTDCKYCLEQSCNDMSLNSGATGVHIFIIVSLFSVALTVFKNI